MFGVPVIGPTSILCDNQGMVKNASLPEMTLLKRHNVINYHSVWESVAAGITWVRKEDRVTSLADAFTKTLLRTRHYKLFSRIGYLSMFSAKGRKEGGGSTEEVQPNLQVAKRVKFIH